MDDVLMYTDEVITTEENYSKISIPLNSIPGNDVDIDDSQDKDHVIDDDDSDQDIMQAEEPFVETTTIIAVDSTTYDENSNTANNEEKTVDSVTTETSILEEESTSEIGIIEAYTSTTSISDTTISNDSENLVDFESSTTEDTTETITTEATDQPSTLSEENKTHYVNKLSDQIRNVLTKYKQSGNVIIPDIPIPDPLNIPDMENRFSMATMNFMNQTVYGLSNFTLQQVNTDLEKMQVSVLINFPP